MSHPEMYIPEHLSGKPVPIYTPEVFDRKVEQEAGFRDIIAGFTTIGIEHFKRGWNAPTPQLLPYGDPNDQVLHAMVAADVLLGVFEATRWDGITEDLDDLISQSRGYGHSAMFTEAIALHTTKPYKEMIKNLTLEEALEELFLTYDPDVEPLEAVLLSNPHSWLSDPKPAVAVLDAIGIPHESIPDIGNMLRGRGGVQIVYEKSAKFSQLLADSDFMFDTAALGSNAIVLSTPIPKEYMLCIVPFGEVEQKALAS